MKKYILLLVSFSFAGMLSAQVNVNGSALNGAADGSTAFLDASSSKINNVTNDLGKGLVFPQVNLKELKTLKVKGRSGVPTNYPTNMDGMVVYNVGEGVPGIGKTKTPKVTPGFYYYENKTNDLQGGHWVRFASGVTKDSKEPDYKDNVAVATGADFYISSTDSKPVYRRMIPLTFSNSATVTLASNPFTANDVFINAYLVKKDSKERIGSVRIEGDKVFSSNGSLFTVLDGDYYLIAEYYTK